MLSNNTCDNPSKGSLSNINDITNYNYRKYPISKSAKHKKKETSQ